MRPKSLVLLILALGCGLVASIGINQVLANRNTSNEPGETVPVFVALKDIGIGDPLKAENLKIEEWPKDKVPPNAITKLEDTENRRASTKIFPGEPLLEVKLLPKGETGASVVDYVPKGMRLIPVRVDDVSSVAGLLKPGDRVDLLVHLEENASKGISKTTTKTFLQNIKVQAINDVFRRDTEGQATPVAKTISLLVTPAQAEMVMFATELGSIRMVLRNTEDEVPSETDGAGIAGLVGGNADESQTKSEPDGGLDLLKMLNQQRNAEPAPVAPIVSAPTDHWKMVLLEGPLVRQVEFENGAPINMDTTSTPTTPAVNPTVPTTTDEPPAAKDAPSGDTPKGDPSAT